MIYGVLHGRNCRGSDTHFSSITERSGRADSSRRLVGNRPMFTAQCQVEDNRHITSISVYEYELKSDEEFLQNALKQAKTKTKTLQ